MRTSGLLAFLILTSGCGIPLSSEGGDWQDSPPFKKSFDEVWNATLAVVESKGLHLQVQDKVSGRILTEWKVHLDPRWREGNRERVEAEILPVTGQAEKRFRVRLRVPRDTNDDAKNPMSEKEAAWVSSGGNDETRDELLYRIQMKLKGPGLDD